jgi:hypothetical protein
MKQVVRRFGGTFSHQKVLHGVNLEEDTPNGQWYLKTSQYQRISQYNNVVQHSYEYCLIKERGPIIKRFVFIYLSIYLILFYVFKIY